MMPLEAGDLAVIALTSLTCTVCIAAIALLLLRIWRRRPVVVQLLVVTVATVTAIVVSVLAISIEMYLSEHDLAVLVWVIGVASGFGVLAAVALARMVRSSMQSLTTAARSIGDEEPLVADDGADEFAELSRELAAVSARVRAARTELEDLDSARRRFFAWISHDLRTPLAALRVVAEAAERDAHASTRELGVEVRARTTRLTTLVDDLFELSQLTAGQLTLRPEQLDLHDAVSDTVTELRTATTHHGVRVVADGLHGQVVWADPHRFGRIVSNILSNAIRHAPKDSEILITATELPGGRVVLGVLDRGSGVAATDLDRMFEVGWRDDRARTSPPDEVIASGAGLGLAIARGLARAHGGDLTAEHTAEGFRMNVLLPVSAPATAAVRPQE